MPNIAISNASLVKFCRAIAYLAEGGEKNE